MEKATIRFLKEHLQEVEDVWQEQLRADESEMATGSLQEELFEKMLEQTMRYIRNFLNHLDIQKFVQELGTLNRTTVQLFPFIEAFETSTYYVLRNQKDKKPAESMEILQYLRKIVHSLSIELLKYEQERYNKIIHLQKISLQELSTPIIPVFDRVIVIPIIGAIDRDRAKQIMENVLHAVVSNKSEIVLIDITGLLVLDTVVAHHLIEVVNAIHIVGGKSMLVGIRPEIAQTIVQLGVDLSDVTTLGTLQEGIEKALEETNRCIREVIH